MTLNHHLYKEIRNTFTKWRRVGGCGESALREWVGHVLIARVGGPLPSHGPARRLERIRRALPGPVRPGWDAGCRSGSRGGTAPPFREHVSTGHGPGGEPTRSQSRRPLRPRRGPIPAMPIPRDGTGAVATRLPDRPASSSPPAGRRVMSLCARGTKRPTVPAAGRTASSSCERRIASRVARPAEWTWPRASAAELPGRLDEEEPSSRDCHPQDGRLAGRSKEGPCGVFKPSKSRLRRPPLAPDTRPRRPPWQRLGPPMLVDACSAEDPARRAGLARRSPRPWGESRDSTRAARGPHY